MVGYAFMGAAHSQAWRTAPALLRPAAARRRCASSAAATRPRPPRRADRLGWERRRDRLAAGHRARRHRPRRHLHAGRHPRRDRDRGPRGRQARAVREAAGQHRRRGRGDDRGRRRGPPRTACGRWSASPTAGCRRSRWPARWSPRAGSATVRHVRAQYLQDWIADPEAPLSGGCDKDKAGSGALGDIGAHIVDLTQFITGDRITDVSRHAGDVRQGAAAADRAARPRPRRRRRSGGPVTVDDAAAFLARFAGGALGVFEATRFATGRKNAIRIEINGSRGQPGVRLRGHERPALLRRARSPTRPPASAGSSSPSPSHPYVGAWWPPGHGLGYEHGFTHQVVDLVTGDRRRAPSPTPTFADGLQVQRVLAAVETRLRHPHAGRRSRR